jgi:hypothetical protein
MTRNIASSGTSKNLISSQQELNLKIGSNLQEVKRSSASEIIATTGVSEVNPRVVKIVFLQKTAGSASKPRPKIS